MLHVGLNPSRRPSALSGATMRVCVSDGVFVSQAGYDLSSDMSLFPSG